MKIGITGSQGVLGSILLKKTRQKGYEDNCFAGDITKLRDVKDWVSSNKFDNIVHLAALVPTIEVQKNLTNAFGVNAVGTKDLVEVLNTSTIKPWVFYASTSHVYKSSKKKITENSRIEPVSEYGITKYAGEILAKKNYENLCIGRIFSMYHKTQSPPFLYPSIKERLENEDLSKEFELYGAESVRDFLNAESIADIIIKLMEKQTQGIYNIASGKGIKVQDFVKKMTKKKIKIKNMGKSDYLVADISKLNKELNGK